MALAKLASLLTATTSSPTTVSPPRVDTDPSPSPRVARSQSPSVASPPGPSPPQLTTPRKLVSHLEAGPYWDKPVGPRRARPSHTAGYANAIHAISEKSPTNGRTTNRQFYKNMHHVTSAPPNRTMTKRVRIAYLIMSILPTQLPTMSPGNSLNTVN